MRRAATSTRGAAPRDEETPYPLSDSRDTAIDRDLDEPRDPEPEEEIDERESEPPRPVPQESTYNVLVQEDGTFLEAATEKTYDTVEKLLVALAPEGGARPTVFLINATDAVTKETLEAVAEKLRDRCTVRTSYRAPDKEDK